MSTGSLTMSIPLSNNIHFLVRLAAAAVAIGQPTRIIIRLPAKNIQSHYCPDTMGKGFTIHICILWILILKDLKQLKHGLFALFCSADSSVLSACCHESKKCWGTEIFPAPRHLLYIETNRLLRRTNRLFHFT